MELKKKIIIRACIKGLAEEGRRQRSFIRESSKDERWANWQVKRDIGVHARYHLLAYAFLEGRSFRSVEPYTDVEHVVKALSESILDVVNRFAHWQRNKKNVYVPGKGYVYMYTLEEITEWVDQPKAPPQPKKPRVRWPYDPSKDTRIKVEK